MCVKLLVSPNTCGKIIGRGGAEIKAIRDQLGVGMHIHTLENVFPKAPDRQIAVLFGDRENIDGAFQTIVDKIVEAEPPPDPSALSRVSVLIPQNAVSAIIGTKGATIRELRNQSGCNISADTDIIAGEQLVHVTGHMDSLATALSLLTPLIEKSGDSLQYVEAKYGMGGAHGAQKGMFNDGGKGGMASGMGKGKGKAPPSMSGGMSQMGGMPHSQHHLQEVFGHDTPHDQQEQMVMESQTSLAFSIPKDAIGRVLGKAGSSSKEIQRLTGVHLKIDPREEDGLVTLTGPLHAAHKAHCMVVGRVLSPY